MKVLSLVARALLVSLVLVFAGCTTGKKTEKSERESGAAAAELSEADRKKLEEYQVEMDVGRNMAGRLLAFYGRVDSEALIGYVNQVGNYVASNGDFPNRRYMFDVINTEEVNAFACPGGYVLVTMGAVRHARNEAELAMILGHEAAHVGERHMFTTLKSMSEQDIQKAAADADKKEALPAAIKNRERPKPEQSATGALVARYMSGSNFGLNILAASKAGMSLILEKGLGAHLEYAADAAGVKYAVNAGYDPKALVDFLCRLEDSSHVSGKRCKAAAKRSGAPATVLDKTHPPVGDRIKGIVKVLAAMDAKNIVGATGEQRFKANVVNLPAAKKSKTH